MVDTPAQLLSLARPGAPGVVARRVTRPSTPLADAALLTNSHGEPSMGAELRAELDTADRVDLLCAFVKWSGLRILEPELARAKERGVPLRVITTTYVGATERVALDRLVRDYGAEVRVEYDAAADQAACQGVAVPSTHRVRHGVRRLLEPLSRGAAGRRGVERPALVRRHPGLDEQVRRDVRDVLEQLHVRDVRPGPGPRPAGRCPCRGLWPQGHRPRDHLSVRHGGAALPLPGRDAGTARGRAGGARPTPQPGCRSDGDRQDSHRGVGLPRPLSVNG